VTLDELKKLFSDAVFIRAFENGMADLAREGAVPGLLHLSNGSEVAELMLARYLNAETDKVFGSHRSHSLALSGGVDAGALALEILGLKGGLADGVGGTQHILSAETLFMSSNGIVGAQVPHALGAALSAKTMKTGGIGVAVFGDGASNQGAVFESLNLATVLNLPALFFVENNGLAQSTDSSELTAGQGVAVRTRSFGMPTEQVDGYDLYTLDQTLERVIGYVRDASMPAMIEVFVPRLSGHYFDPDSAGVDENADPIDQLIERLEAQEVSKDAIDALRDSAQSKIATLVEGLRSRPDFRNSEGAQNG
jgi:pyruvate dehydrogenase E1 component alpha subunit